MNREVLFRGRRVDNGEWVYGVPWEAVNGTGLCYMFGPQQFDGETVMAHIQVDPATVCQYTGLTDKNGVKIFEGDMIKWGHVPGYVENPVRVAVVKMNPDIQFDMGFHIFHFGSFMYSDVMDSAAEVIGSIN